MSYLGNSPTEQAFVATVDYFNGNGSTVSFTLSRQVTSVAQVQAVIENVPQNPSSAFTVLGNVITFTSAPPVGTANIYVYYTSPNTKVIAPSSGTVGTDALAAGAVVPAKMANGGAEFFSNNLLINGSFDIAQRGSTISNWGSFGYTIDNVQIGYDGTPPSGRTVNQQTFAMGQTDINEGDPRFYLEYIFPICGTPTNYLRFPVESVRTLSGKQATFSFWAKVPSGTMTIGVAIAQEFGSGGSPSVGVYPAQTNYTVTSTWQKFVYTTTLSSIADKTIGTNNNDMIWPAIWCPTNAAGTIQLANLKLEEGSTATPFRRRPIQIERALCQRYLPAFKASAINEIFGSHYNANASIARAVVPFQVTPRVVPTGAVISAAGDFYASSNVNMVGTSVVFYGASLISGSIQVTGAGGQTTGQAGLTCANTANAQVIFTGCEL